MSKISIFCWNVNGIRAVLRKDALLPFINQYQPDILGLQETKAQPEQIELDLPAYSNYWCSASKKGYSGTGILSKITPLKTVCGLPKDLETKYNLTDNEDRDASDEGRVVTAEYDKFYFVSVYTPNAKDDLSRIPLRFESWDPAFLEYCLRLEKRKPVIFGGDLNVAYKPIDLARPKENEGKKGYTKEEREGLGRYIEAGFIDTFRAFYKDGGHYSWWSHWANARERNIGWRIDYIFISPRLKDKLVSAAIHPEVMGSDHCPISIELELDNV